MKKVLALVLAVMLVVGMAPMVSAAPIQGYPGDAKDAVSYAIGNTRVLGMSDSYVGLIGDYENLDTVRPDDEYDHYYLYASDGTTWFQMNRTNIKNAKIDVRTKVSEGSRALDKVEIKYDSNGAAYLKVTFVENYVSTSELDFDITLYLTVNKKRDTETEFQIVGTLENEDQYVSEGDDYVNTEDVPVVEAEDYIRSIQVECGNGVSIWTRMFADRKYYAQVSVDVKPEDDEIIAQYPSIDSVYYLTTIGLNSASNYVTFDLDEVTRMYVYNSDMEYIGTTSDRLPYSTKYYLSTVELDVADANDDIDDDDDDYPDYIWDDDDDDEEEKKPDVNPDMGGDDVPANVNDNPGTGC